jgi:hypothetical protein
MSHEWMHLNIYVMKNWIRKDAFIGPLAILPFSHPNQSMPFHVTWNALASPFHGKMPRESFIGHAIGHLPIQPSQLIIVFSCHIRMHLPFHPMGKCMGNILLVILLAIFPCNHLNKLMFFHATLGSICLFIPWGNSWEIFHCPTFWPSSHSAILTNHCLVL